MAARARHEIRLVTSAATRLGNFSDRLFNSQAGKPALRHCVWPRFARCRFQVGELHPFSYSVIPADHMRIATNCNEPSTSLMNDTVPNFPSPGNEVSRRVPIWPRSDMLQCVPMLLGKDMLHPVSILPGKDASHRVPVLSGREVFYPVPISINRRKRKNPTEILNLF